MGRFSAWSAMVIWLLVGASVAGAGVCDPLPPPTGTVVTVSNEADLRTQAMTAVPRTTIMVAAGVYAIADYLHVINSGITIRGATGDRDDVILDFGGMSGGAYGIQVYGDDVTIADLTIRNANDHGVDIKGVDRPVLYNLHIQDIGDQLVKVNPAGDGSDDGLLACSLLEYTTTAPNNYTNGISAHDAHDWVVRDNVWRRIRPLDGVTPLPTILFWSGSTDTVVERNLLVDCIQGIAFGNASHGPGDHTGGIVRNNVIYNTLPHDVAVEMVYATGWRVAHNTVMLLNPGTGQTWGMEARFTGTTGEFVNNLTNMAIWPDRDGAGATTTGNVTTAATDWFLDAAGEDFRLTAGAAAAVDQGAPVAGVTADMEGQARDVRPDIGADEWAPGLAEAVTILRIAAGLDGECPLADDVDNDGRTGLPEAIAVLQKIAGVR